jgi:hypothetical protein
MAREADPFEVLSSEVDSAFKDGFREALDGDPRDEKVEHSPEWHRGYKAGTEWASKNQRIKE